MNRQTFEHALALPWRMVKRILPRTLFARSLLIIITPVLLLQVIVTFIFFDRHWDTMTVRLAYAASGEIALIAEQINEAEDAATKAKTVAESARMLGLLVSYDPEMALDKSQSLADLETPLLQTLGRALKEKVRGTFYLRMHEKEWVEVLVAMDAGTLSVMVPEKRLFSSTTYIFILWVIGSSLVLTAIAILFMRNQIRPILRLAVAAERFGMGRDVPKFKPEGASEVRQAAAAFIEMRERIRRQLEQRTAMLAGVSHDLRTPITRLRLQLAMLGDSPDVEAMKEDLNEMEMMVEGYLSFARGESGETPESTDMSKLLERIVMGARRQGTDITLQCENDLTLTCRPLAIERCLSNLISNARKYGHHVWVQAHRHPDAIEIVVEDDGPGIPMDQREEVMKPFSRLEASRNPETGGVGLGLTIANDIAHTHGGRILLEDSNRGGLRAVVRLPY